MDSPDDHRPVLPTVEGRPGRGAASRASRTTAGRASRDVGGFGHTVDPRVQAQGRPLGFRDDTHRQQVVTLARQRLAAAGYHDTQLAVRGSSVTGIRFTTGEAFDVGKHSDIDLAVISETMFQQARGAGVKLLGNRTAALRYGHLRGLGLSGLYDDLIEMTGRKTSIMVYRDLTSIEKRGPSIMGRP